MGISMDSKPCYLEVVIQFITFTEILIRPYYKCPYFYHISKDNNTQKFTKHKS